MSGRAIKAKRKQSLRHEIILAMKAGGALFPGELWFNLIFLSEAGLKRIARELHIRTD